MNCKYLTGAATALALVALVTGVSGANAATISIGYSQDGAATTTVAGSGTSDLFSVSGVNTGNFTFTAGGVTQTSLPAPGLIFSNSTSVKGESATGHSLDIWVTAQGLTVPLGNPLGVLSGFTTNLLLGGFTTTLETFLSSANALFTGTTLGSSAFLSPGTVTSLNSANTGPGPYSVTAHYHVDALTAAGAATSTISAVAVPGPLVGAGLPGLLAACVGLLTLARRRRSDAVA